jgi:hypothetical protein
MLTGINFVRSCLKTQNKRQPLPNLLVAPQIHCPFCHINLWISQHRKRTIIGLDETVELLLRDKKCPSLNCPQPHLRYRDPQEPLWAPPGSQFGMDVILEIGNMRFRKAMSFSSIHQELLGRQVPISLMAVQYQCRKFQTLINAQVSPSSGAIFSALKQRGFILPIVDGITFGGGESVIYLIMDSLSGLPLFGREMTVRGKDDLVPFIAQVKTLGLPIIGVVSDKEKGLAPAISKALDGVPQQFCQLHYVQNVAKPLQDDLAGLGKEIREQEEKLREFQRELIRLEARSQAGNEEMPADVEIAKAFCEAGRAAARRCGRELTEPAALKQHEEIRRVEQAVVRARRKKGGIGNTLTVCEKSCNPHRKRTSLRGA